MSASRGTLKIGKAFPLEAPATHLFLSFGAWATGKAGGFSKQQFGQEDAKIARDNFHNPERMRTQGRQSVPIYAGFPDLPGTRGHNPAASAVGWVDDFIIEAQGVRLPVKWGKLGQEILRDESYKLHAPLWAMRTANGVSRPFKLVAIGLLNHEQAIADIEASANDIARLSEGERREAMQRAIKIEMSLLDQRLGHQERYEIAWRRAVKTYYP